MATKTVLKNQVFEIEKLMNEGKFIIVHDVPEFDEETGECLGIIKRIASVHDDQREAQEVFKAFEEDHDYFLVKKIPGLESHLGDIEEDLPF